MAGTVGLITLVPTLATLDVASHPLPLRVAIDGGQEVVLPRTAPGFAVKEHLLTTMAEIRRHAYVETFDSTITGVSVPVVGTVLETKPLASRDVLVNLDRSATCHVLRANEPGHESLLQRLTTRVPEGFALSVTSRRHTQEIFDVRVVKARVEPAACTLPTEPEPRQDQIIRALNPVNIARIEAFIANVMLATCPTTLSARQSCIPFLFAESFCWARAHKLCQMLADEEIPSAKLWIYAKDMQNLLRARTSNLPSCRTRWNYHVAPVVRVVNEGRQELRVIDPSLFPFGSVLQRHWIESMHASEAVHEYSDTKTYIAPRPRPAGRVGECAGQTEEDLRLGLAALQELLDTDKHPQGPPPYTPCTSLPVPMFE